MFLRGGIFVPTKMTALRNGHIVIGSKIEIEKFTCLMTKNNYKSISCLKDIKIKR